ncbi:MAG TPA: hypothetical protein DHW71_11600 [Gammaproteobacteria bacterium]|nr:hypothetical protein [Gammaproteobacteria bacterium]HBF08814.1 hypothetical protein [Gammaproteobacteria bacterium]HCK93629.1 hypothetical protein [Gammaproteobacteria bacterium]|tara:strand:- start:2317 stop:3390 length:1074 start_codon:yes stop_codon:yes gene_type:complete
MAQAAQLQQNLQQDLTETLSRVISTRPEWRFLEQQRHLQDVLKLFIRELLTHSKQATHEQWSNNNSKQKGLTLSWLSLILSQELQHPPQLTKDNFINVFYSVLTTSENELKPEDIVDSSSIELNTMPPVRRQSFCVSSSSHDTTRIQQQMFQMTNNMFRIQETHIGWQQPSFHIKHFLPFLNHIVPARWTHRYMELLTLLKKHDSMLSFAENKPEFTKSNLHSSHPLRKQAAEQVQQQLAQYKNLNTIIESNINEFNQLLSKLAQEKPSVLKVLSAITHMQNAWQQTGILNTYKDITLELQVCLFEEAEYQRESLAQLLKKPLGFLEEKKTILAYADQTLISKVQQLFEVNYERTTS